ncbi:orotidine-5'-phosphate decarboxylase [Oceanobacillus caeni]|uniref:Orotidine 5'-phosphate decarboxylase n=1 Tax=Oceanobacillus caeni TaxID=405946 RepID=A0ABR5MLX6_9BACI|nr:MULTISPECIES: orotidine-5'-phosphate decarboxylase [Bacillaceae]KKE78038.1 orotidine 5'-phosphate decarboxylase [Bacilli bacterium VT-13-104]PZD85694.1 orotidine-5'-phosphate decarboxylase [Bacilli bacterium]KPH77159.1 orotidine 5'-phosphate decarboxylase [Oceanobacillus caeni]MBU8790153.1 orotidine-5'-phosphate decarboxylase [Oceanobacillus caeni]MCR1835597.1 orotidine-5'-phosphate decarboxylase [Oceanobacillus caeni]
MSNQLIYIALDFENWNETEKFLVNNDLTGVPVKVGMELFYREGPAVIEKLKENNHPIFLDLKLHDIPTTVKKAMHNLGKLGVDIVNVHALGGSDMIKAAKEGLLSSNTETKLIAVTILTSMDKQVLNNDLLIPGDVLSNAMHFASLAKQSGADGVVCSVHEANDIKKQCGNDFLTVTPGIRLENTDVNDQKRVATPSYAKENGADILVIGRSITKARNPRVAYETALKECGLT